MSNNNCHKPLKSSWKSEPYVKTKVGRKIMTYRSLSSGKIIMQKRGNQIVSGNFHKNSNQY